MNIYKEHALNYFHKGYNVIPDGYMSKKPPKGFMGWSQFCDEPISKDRMLSWFSEYTKTNIAIPLGSHNGLCVIDVDTTDKKMQDFLRDNLPYSPVERIGSKGFVRFYRCPPGTYTYVVKGVNGVIFELLANNKKVTIAPSKHPAGMDYTWTDKGLLDVDKDEIPYLPTSLISNLEIMLRAEFPDDFGKQYDIQKDGSQKFKVSNGRTDALKTKTMQLLNEMDKSGGTNLLKIVDDILEFDLKEHEGNPLFEDMNEQSQMHSHAQTNALKFVVSMLDYVQGRRFKDNKLYSTISCGGFVTDEEIDIYKLGLQYKQLKSGTIKSIKRAKKRYGWE